MVKKFHFFDIDALKNFHKRIFFSIIVFIFVYSIAFYRIFDLMLLNNQTNYSYFKEKLIERGNIYDRNGYLLASTIKSHSLSVNPFAVKDKEKISKELSLIISKSQQEILKLLNKKSKFVWLKKDISPREHQKIIELGEAVLNTEHSYEEQRRRIYPYQNIASHVIGYTNTEELGLSGIERGFDEKLSRGENINLSIDINLQQAIRNELINTLEKYSADSATAIVLDITNGEIISLNSLPDFDPNNRKTFLNKTNTFNRALSGNFEMGSVFKPITIAMGFDKGIIKEDMIFDVSKPIKGIEDFEPYDGSYNVKEIIVNSSNIGTAKIASLIGKKNQKDFFQKIGFNDKINYEIKESALPLGNKNNWEELETMTIGFGHGFAITPLHLISAYAALSNNGNKIIPTFIKDKKYSNSPKIVKNETSEFFKKLLRAVVLETKFTGPRVNVKGYEIGGKTGTAELLDNNGRYKKDANLTLFVAIFPVSQPKYAVMATIENPKKIKESNYSITAATVVAPLIKDIVNRMIEILGISVIKSQEILKADTTTKYSEYRNVSF